MQNKHICFLQYNLRGGGAERKVCTLANYFAAQGYQVEIGLFGVNMVAYELAPSVKVTFLRREFYEYRSGREKMVFGIKSFAIKVTSALVRLASKRLSDRIAAHFKKEFDYTQPIRRFIENRDDAVFISMMAQAYNEIMRIIEKDIKRGRIHCPYIVMECSNPSPGLDVTPADVERRNRYYPMAARCVAMTQGAVDCFDESIRKRCVVIPNPLRNDLPEPYEGDRRKVVVNYCRLHRAKNLPLLLEAFAAFHANHPDYRLEVIGEGELEEALNRQITALGVTDCACILPFDPNVHRAIRDCAMYVSSSDWEGFPNSVMEALALGIPTICTDCDFGPRDMIRDHENGLLVPMRDAGALCHAMSELADNPVLADRLACEGVKARETYNVETIGRKWLDLIEAVQKERGLT